jgi:uncharacterized membrane protein YfcA
MSIAILVSLFFSLGFFVESIAGFGSAFIAYPTLGLLIDIKELILIGLYVGTCASSYIVLSSFKSFTLKVFLSSLLISAVGTIIGVIVFGKSSSHFLLVLFGILLIILSIKMIFFDQIKFPKSFKIILLLIGGIAQGIFGLGGAFLVAALQNDFKNKSQLRATMAAFFVTFNLIRFTQLYFSNQLNLKFSEIWWVSIPTFIAIYLGHKVHLKISEKTFKIIIATITTIAGIYFLFKSIHY